MGSLIYLPDPDINTNEMARKVVMHKRNGGGLEAPRNSFELPIETSYGLYTARDNILYAHHMTKESSGEDYYSTEAPIKKLICEEFFVRSSTRSKSPSVVARLMGVDVLPFDSKSGSQLVDIKNGSPMDKLMDKNQLKKGSAGHILSIPNCSQQLEVDPIGCYVDGYPDLYSSRMKLNKPKHREHPQEEELQKFKQEFEARQSARLNKCSNFVKFNSPPELIAQEELNREKMHLYANSYRTTMCESLREHNGLSELNDPREMLAFERIKKKSLCYADEGKESLYPNRGIRTDFRASQLMKSGQALGIVSAPSKIVVLRPGPDTTNINDYSWGNTPSTSEGIGTIEEFLEEVKDRLESEMQGKCSKRSTTVRGRGIETPYREKPSRSREIAQSIAQEVRDSVSRDLGLGMNLPRSESTRSYRSDIQNETGSPEFINRDARKFLAERLRNVLKGENHRQAVHNSSHLSMSGFEKGKPGHLRKTWIGNDMNHPDSFATELEKHSCSFRGEPDEVGMPHQTDMSPRNLMRSLSTPISVSERSFGKLLLEDRHILSGAQIRRKHEATEKVSVNIKKQKKDKFNIREKVSSFRYNLTFRGRLFRRRVKSLERSGHNKNNLLKDIPNGPTAMSFYDTHGNSTEVPPSPASVCSSVHDEFWRSNDYLSPISSSGGHQLEDSDVSHVFREINSNLNELRRKLDQFEGSCLEETIHELHPTEVDTDIEDQSEAYIRDLLIAAGLYDDSFSRSLSKWNPLGKPIGTEVFDEVEETYKESTKVKDEGEKINHKIMVDLLNEVLPVILREPVNISRYMEKAIGLVHKTPNGRKLLSLVWNSIRVYVHPPVDRCYYALDNVLARDLESTPWSRLIDDDVNALGRDMECLIIRDMIEEMVKDMYF